MLLSATRSVCLLLTALVVWTSIATASGTEEIELPPPLPPKGAADPLPVRKTRHYIVQVKLIEVDEQGRETVLGEPKLQTAGGNAGISVDHPDGRRFDFTIRLSDRLGGDELVPARTPATSQLEGMLKKLDQKIDLNAMQQPRREILRDLARKAGVSIAIDPESIRTVAAEMDSPVDLKLKDETISTALDRLIEPLNLGYAVKHDVILIAAQEKLLPGPDEFIVKTYNVADLIRKGADRETPDFEPLIERIKSSVMPSSWERKEATATIRPFNSTQSIVVRQTATGHAAIERLLEKIRHEKPMKIAD